MSLSENATAFGELEPEDVEVPVFRGCQMEKDDEKLATSEAGHIEVCHGREVVIDQQDGISGKKIGPESRKRIITLRMDISSLEALMEDVMRATVEEAAVACYHMAGQNDARAADQCATDAMKKTLNARSPIPLEIGIGEGEKDGMPGLPPGMKLGPPFTGEPGEIWAHIAVDPLEGTDLCAKNMDGAICVIACAINGEGSIMPGVDGYMHKLVMGPVLAQAWPDFANKYGGQQEVFNIPHSEIARWAAKVRGKEAWETYFELLDRPRNDFAVASLRSVLAKVGLIKDGDVNSVVKSMDPEHEVEVATGVGATSEGHVGACIAQSCGGLMFGKYFFDYDKGAQQRQDLLDKGIDVDRVYSSEEMATGHVVFALAGVTNGLVPGVRRKDNGDVIVHSIVGRNRTGTIRTCMSRRMRPEKPKLYFSSR